MQLALVRILSTLCNGFFNRPDVDFTVSYPCEFDTTTLEEELDQAADFKLTVSSPKAHAKIDNELCLKRWPDMSRDEREAIFAENEAAATATDPELEEIEDEKE
jgi:hypothetical protein